MICDQNYLRELCMNVISRNFSEIFFQVHDRFIRAVKSEIRQRRLEDPDHRHSIVLLSELMFYTQSLLRLNVMPAEKLTRDAMEYIWFDL